MNKDKGAPKSSPSKLIQLPAYFNLALERKCCSLCGTNHSKRLNFRVNNQVRLQVCYSCVIVFGSGRIVQEELERRYGAILVNANNGGKNGIKS
ncbi:MAG: hypothetical protein WCI04_05840 [archaeon]